MSGFGRGESGINSMPREKYYEDCDPESVSAFFCSYFGVSEPRIEVKREGVLDRWHGFYYPDRKLIRLKGTLTGLVLHELAHHIVRELGKNGRGHHNPQYWSVLQEMHDLWK